VFNIWNLKLMKFSLLEAILPSKQDLNKFLHQVVPQLVDRYIIQSQSIKACSSISPAFEVLAKQAGFPTQTEDTGRHVVNYVTTSDGVFRIDLSAIQFDFCPDYNVEWSERDFAGDDPHRVEVQRLLDIVKKDPMQAIDVRSVDDSPYSGWSGNPKQSQV